MVIAGRGAHGRRGPRERAAPTAGSAPGMPGGRAPGLLAPAQRPGLRPADARCTAYRTTKTIAIGTRSRGFRAMTATTAARSSASGQLTRSIGRG